MKVKVDEQNIIAILGIESLPDERKLELIDKVSGVVEKRLFIRMLNSLSEKKRKELDNLMDAENEESINLFVEQNVPDMQIWMVEEINKIKQELATLTGSL